MQLLTKGELKSGIHLIRSYIYVLLTKNLDFHGGFGVDKLTHIINMAMDIQTCNPKSHLNSLTFFLNSEK